MGMMLMMNMMMMMNMMLMMMTTTTTKMKAKATKRKILSDVFGISAIIRTLRKVELSPVCGIFSKGAYRQLA